jgi:folate-binding protein YgfZ
MTSPSVPTSASPPEVGTIGVEPRPVVLDYGDPAAEYATLRSGALLVGHGDRDLWIFEGAAARETLAGLVTNDVAGLTPGHGHYAAALTPKGRIIADVRIYAIGDTAIAPANTPAIATRLAPVRAAGAGAGEDGAEPTSWPPGAALLVDVPARAAEGWGALIRKYVNPRLAAYRRETSRVRAFGVYGARSRDAVAEAFALPPAALAALPPYGHATVETREGTMHVARVPDLALDGFMIYAAVAAADAAWARVAREPGVAPGGHRAWDVARIEAGRPEWGIDIDDTTIPQEANFDELHAISYTKGCYTGQEVVARVHFRGHVNRHLRGIAYPPDGGPLPVGARLIDETGRDIGDVRSAAISPRLGGIALGMVRREIPLGATLIARAVATAPEALDSDRLVTVGPLPFPL